MRSNAMFSYHSPVKINVGSHLIWMIYYVFDLRYLNFNNKIIFQKDIKKGIIIKILENY